MSSKNGRRFSHESRAQRNRKILAMHERGISTGEICDCIGVSYNTFSAVLLSLGVSRRAIASGNRNEAAAQYAAGDDPKAIAKRFGRSFDWVHAACIEHGVSRRTRVFEDRKKAAALVADGEEPKRVAKRFGRSLRWVNVACAEHGVRLTSAGPGRPTGRVLFVIADLQNNPDDTFQVIADRHSITRARAHQIMVEAIGCGVCFPGRRLTTVKTQPADTETQG